MPRLRGSGRYGVVTRLSDGRKNPEYARLMRQLHGPKPVQVKNTSACRKCSTELTPSNYLKERRRGYICNSCWTVLYRGYGQRRQREKPEEVRRAQREWVAKNPTYHKRWKMALRERNPYLYWASSVLRAHRGRGHAVELTVKELERAARDTRECGLCGCNLAWVYAAGERRKRTPRDNPSLDRRDNGNTLTLDNIMIVCFRCNASKQERTLAQFVEYCSTIVSRFGKPELTQKIL